MIYLLLSCKRRAFQIRFSGALNFWRHCTETSVDKLAISINTTKSFPNNVWLPEKSLISNQLQQLLLVLVNCAEVVVAEQNADLIFRQGAAQLTEAVVRQL